MKEAAPPLFKLEVSPEAMVTKRASVVHFLFLIFDFLILFPFSSLLTHQHFQQARVRTSPADLHYCESARPGFYDPPVYWLLMLFLVVGQELIDRNFDKIHCGSYVTA